ncbi:MAG: hypothetical protein JXA54_12795 [Candidatus Heimdallarchaeota archaeon]|nr:hypothetical protein [Candidatus Heimdallarchaeota archaeon]
MNEELTTKTKTSNIKNTKLALIGIGFICGYFLLIFIKEFIAFLRFTPQINVFEDVYEILNPTLIYAIFIPFIIGLILVIISFNRYKNNSKYFRKQTVITRNLFIIALIIRPLTYLYYVLIALIAWGDDLFAQYLWTGGDLINHIFILLPMIFLSLTLKKEQKNSTNHSISIIFPKINIWFLSIWIFGYLISLYLNFNIFNDPFAMGMTIMINSLIQLIFNSLGIAMFVELGMKIDKHFKQKEEEI